jgi:hypothetical protein
MVGKDTGSDRICHHRNLMERCPKFPHEEGLGFQAVCCERLVCKM